MAKQRIIPIVYKVDYKQVDQSTQSVKKAEQATDKLNKEIKETESVGAKSFGRLKDAIIASGIIALVGTISKRIFDIGVSAEQTTISFNTFLGSAEKAKRLIGDLNKFAIITPYTNDQVNRAAKTLLAFGVEAKKIIPTLKLIGDVSSGTGKDLSEMAVIFGQIRSTGRLMGQDLLQLINAGFNPLQIISEKTGKSVIDLKKEMEKGLITFEMVEGAFKDATSEGGLFFNLMEAQSKTIGGKISTLSGNFEELGKTFFKLGSGPIPFLVDGFNDLATSINQFLKSGEIDDIVDARLQRFRDAFEKVEKDVEEKKGFASLNQLFMDLTIAINGANEEITDLQSKLELVELEPGLEKDLGSAEFLRTSIRVLKEEIKGLDQLRVDLDGIANPIKETGKTATKTAEQIAKLKEAMKPVEEGDMFVNLFPEGYDPMYDEALKNLEDFGKQWDKEQKDQYDRQYEEQVEAANKSLEKQRETAAMKRQIEEDAFNFAIDAIGGVLLSTTDSFDAENEALQAKYDEQIRLAGDNENAKKRIEEQRAEEEKKLRLKQFEEEKKQTTRRILIETVMNAVKALGLPPIPGANFIAAGKATAYGLLAAGLSRRYAKGSEVGIDGAGTTTSDSIPAMLSRGETVMSYEQTESSKGILKAIKAKKLNDQMIEKLYRGKAGTDGGAFTDKRIVEAIKGQKQPDVVKIGSYLYDVRSKNSDHKQFVRRKYIS